MGKWEGGDGGRYLNKKLNNRARLNRVCTHREKAGNWKGLGKEEKIEDFRNFGQKKQGITLLSKKKDPSVSDMSQLF